MSWYDFIALFDGLIEELDMLNEALKRMEVSCKKASMAWERTKVTYEEMIK